MGQNARWQFTAFPYPFAFKFVGTGNGLVRKELVQSRLSLRGQSVAGCDRHDVHTQPIQGVAQQLSMVVDGVGWTANDESVDEILHRHQNTCRRF